MRIEHTIEIAAPVQRVWELTLDVEAWPRHTPTITRIELLSKPPLAIGSRARIKQPGQRAKVWTVTELDPERSFVWATRSVGMTMTGSHRMEANGSGTTQTLVVDIEGVLGAIVGRLFRGMILKAIRTENEGFKAAAEAGQER